MVDDRKRPHDATKVGPRLDGILYFGKRLMSYGYAIGGRLIGTEQGWLLASHNQRVGAA